jgi:hypothetical protein
MQAPPLLMVRVPLNRAAVDSLYAQLYLTASGPKDPLAPGVRKIPRTSHYLTASHILAHSEAAYLDTLLRAPR